MTDTSLQTTEEYALGFSIFDEDNPYSLINLIDSDRFKETLHRIRVDCPKMLYWDEWEIERECKPTDLLARLRLAFWDEYEAAVQQKRKMRIVNFVRAHCNRQYFHEVIMGKSINIIYIITPPRKYELTMRQILDKSSKRLLDILDLPITDIRGVPDHKIINAQIKIHAMIDARVKGAVTQKLQIQQHVLSQQIPPEEEVYEKFSLRELDDLQRRIAEHKAEKRTLELEPSREEE